MIHGHTHIHTHPQGSRIPSMGIGGPEEDALRRDLTINALFYNVNTGDVEDFSGQGLADMRDGVIRTPLPALTTLLDDPLRVLRAVRFASRLDFRMSPELTVAASDPRVHQALEQKVGVAGVCVCVGGVGEKVGVCGSQRYWGGEGRIVPLFAYVHICR
jgi:tRNA nucleotidyltransferase/poly(A) polymerase